MCKIMESQRPRLGPPLAVWLQVAHEHENGNHQ
jgi:hypothetical protein